jgi:hypothetical protein
MKCFMNRRVFAWSVPLVVLASGLGLALAQVDVRTTWDDAGVTAGVLVILSVTFSALFPGPPWIWAIAIGAWVPILNIVTSRNFGALMALPIALAAAYIGRALRRAVSS